MYKPNLENEQEQLNLNSFTSKFEHVDTVNLNLGNLKFSFRRIKRQFSIALTVLLLGGIAYFSIPDKKINNTTLHEKYFKEALEKLKERKLLGAFEDLSIYYKAMSLFQKEREHEAIPIFEELIAKNVFFKDECLWNLAGCYMALDMQDNKITKILTEIVNMKSEYSPLALEILNKKVEK